MDASRWNPAATGTTWELSPQLEPLAAYKQYLNVISGTKVKLSNSPQGHHRGSVALLSGRDFITQPANGAPYRSTFAGPSIDQTIAAVTGAMTPFKSLELGISNSGKADVASLVEGQTATLRLLAKAFEKAQIEEINPEGQPFNPEMHEAMMTQPSDAAPNTVLSVTQRGYTLNGRLLRPARVVVSAPAQG